MAVERANFEGKLLGSSFAAGEGLTAFMDFRERIKRDSQKPKESKDNSHMFPPFGVHDPSAPRSVKGWRIYCGK